MKKLSCILFFTCVFFVHRAVLADDDQMRETLVKMINQLDAIKPLLHDAETEQSKNPRIKLHFDSWIDENGKRHLGLRQDIGEIETALIQYINRESVEPRTFEPIEKDFVEAP